MRLENGTQTVAVDHMPLIQPIHNASQLVEKFLAKDFVEMRLFDQEPPWVRQVLKNIINDKCLGLVIPDIQLAAIYPNTFLRMAGAHHELTGHIQTLLKNAYSSTNCVKYHSGLVWLAMDEPVAGLATMIEAASGSMFESITQELVADRREVEYLRPYLRHLHHGKTALNRINLLSDLGEGDDWFCDMCAGPICRHRAGSFLAHSLQESFGLSAETIERIAYEFRASEQVVTTSHQFHLARTVREGTLLLSPDMVITQLVLHKKSVAIDSVEEILAQLRGVLDAFLERNATSGGNPIAFGMTGIPNGRTTTIESQDAIFQEINEETAESTKHARYGKRPLNPLAYIYKKPLRDLISQSFLIATRNRFSLFVSKTAIPTDERMREISISVLRNLKIIAIQTYPYISSMLHPNYERCRNRSGSRCLFRKRLEYPGYAIESNKLGSIEDFLATGKLPQLLKSLEGSLGRLQQIEMKISA
jgi:hypothetical protein